MAALDPTQARAVRELVAEALSQAELSPRSPRRGRPSKGRSEALAVTGDAHWPEDGCLLVDEREAMRALGVKRTTMWALQRQGALTPRYIGRLKRYLRSDLVACAAAMPTRPT